MQIATVTKLETQLASMSPGIYVLRDPEGALVANKTANATSTIVIDTGPNMEAQITQAQTRFTAENV